MNKNHFHRFLDSPVGMLRLEATGDALTSLQFIEDPIDSEQRSNNILSEAATQLNEYFAGKRTSFDLPLQPSGSPFEQQVWEQLKNIGYGTTITYSQIAKRLGDRNKVRAVGRANGQNPLPIIIPCHRVIGANNKLTGYAGGIARKRWLLQHEGALLL